MPDFSKKLKTKKFGGLTIPTSSKMAVSGSMSGVYFHWKGDWYFTCIDGFYVDTCTNIVIDDHRGDNQIVHFK